jgi:hypothetical protein
VSQVKQLPRTPTDSEITAKVGIGGAPMQMVVGPTAAASTSGGNRVAPCRNALRERAIALCELGKRLGEAADIAQARREDVRHGAGEQHVTTVTRAGDQPAYRRDSRAH